MADFEKLGVFYLGRKYDLAAKKITGELVLYDSRDLVTHALVVGMTGSGKTGLAITLLEEAALDGVPAIVIDPKGDLTNLLLTFPDLRAEDFAPWVNEEDAARAGKSVAAFAAEQAEQWKRGLAEWDQDGGRIRRFRDAAEFNIYTPGSTAGIPVSVLGSFDPPKATDPELVRERVQITVSSLLALAGIEGEPLKSREHILLATILAEAWERGERPDLAALVHAVQQPSVPRIGVIDVDSFFPPKERFEFAMTINALLASPGFEVWTQGQPLDVAAFLRSAAGKPRMSIFSIAHLDDSQRMFFVSLLLNAVTGWMRAQAGTTSLRAIVYMDEIFGFFPPVANPPSKAPLLTLLKQGRAAGLGVVLATQNPADLDYKGLSNIGTWLLGRLQTDRDKARVLDGLESAAAGGFDRSEVDSLLSGLITRVFVMRNVHEDGLTVFQSRWALSYLRGPLGRDAIRQLATKGEVPRRTAPVPAPAAASPAPAPTHTVSASGDRPVLPPDVPQFFAPSPSGTGAALRPVAYGAADVRFVDRKLKVDVPRLLTVAATITEGAVPLDWQDAQRVDLAPDRLERVPPPGATFQPVPAAAARPKNYQAWTKQLAVWVAANETIELFHSASSGEVSQPGETERDFRARLQQSAREGRDRRIDALRRKYAPKLAALEEKLRRARQAVDREREEASGEKVQTAISFGATLVGVLLGRKRSAAGALGRATTAARGIERSRKQAEDVQRATETVAALEEQSQRLDDELQAETAALETTTGAATEPLDRIVLKPKQAHVTVKLVALVWMPTRG